MTGSARSAGRTLVAVVVSALLVLAGAVGLVGTAVAAPGDSPINVSYTHSGETYDGLPVLTAGVDYEIRISYGRTADGHTAVLTVPPGVTIPDSALVVPPGNTAVTGLTRQPDGTIAIRFADPFPVGIDQGIIALKFRVDEVTVSTPRQLVWEVDGTSTTTNVIVKKRGDEFENVRDGAGKSAAWVGWTGADGQPLVSVVDGVVRIDDSALTVPIPYTIDVNRTAAGPVTIEDTLGAGLTLVPGSFAATLTTWDADGLNRTTAPAAAPSATGTSFSATVDLPAASRYVLTYQARITDAAALDTVRQQLQASYDALGGNGGQYSTTLTNAAVIGGQDVATSTWIGGSAAAPAGPDASRAFRKSTPTPRIPITTENGALTEGVPVDYVLTADLTPWDASTPRFTLDRDVIITDTLPEQAEWVTAHPSFIAVVDGAGTSRPLTLVSGGKAGVVAAGPFTYSVEGRTLAVNVGRERAVLTVTAKASITTLHRLPLYPLPTNNTYLMGNTAVFDHGQEQRAGTDVRLVEAIDVSGGVVDPTRFSKSGPAEVVVAPGARTRVPYTFVVGAGTETGTFASRVIVDEVDHTVFQVADQADLDAIRDSIQASAGWWVPLSGTHFDVTLDDDGNLRLQLNAAGVAEIASKGLRADERLEVTLALETRPIVGKQTITITNTAKLSGEDLEHVYRSESSTRATTYGDELEVNKTVYDAERDTYTQNLRVGLEPDGSLVQDEFVYRVKVIPHGGYHGVRIRPIADALPDGVEFVGFVTPQNVASGTVTPGTSQNLRGNLTATWDEDSRQVSIQNADGTVLVKESSIDLYFKVRIAEYTPQVGITNVIGGTDATITPTNEFPLDVSKLDSSDPNVSITDRNARFTVTNADGVVVVDDAYVVDGKLRVAGPGGADEGLRVVEPGEYTIHEVVAPAGYTGTFVSLTVVVEDDGSAESARIYNAPRDVPERVSVGDYVWFDVNEDGVQDDTDVPLEGVTLTVLGPDGEPVELDADGNAYESTTTTDAQGRYVFENLPVLTDGQTYTVVVTAPAGYRPTTSLDGGVGAADSSTDRAISQVDLTVDGAHDPSLDFGFVLIPERVSVGDLVWLDSNRDGLQDDGEPGIPGVVLILTGPDGAPVVDVDGTPVSSVTTDANGAYVFENLPVLAEGRSYTVTIDRTDPSTIAALAPYVPTIEVDGRERNSATWSARSQGLTVGGDHDPTLDFGFVTPPVVTPPVVTPPVVTPPVVTPPVVTPPVVTPPVVTPPVVTPPTPVDPGATAGSAARTPSSPTRTTASPSSLPSTGAAPWLPLTTGLVLVIGGLGALTLRRRLTS
ncbi:hypothetical protein C8046_10075 [Serinibacter arcticus]|uniref:SD-repeat containing protein B domain-containing protein n=2 Tax=Serinibacter arcticus TaxID=1655435 RepID=A0A2U1ZVE2_9MICO|nr:hypothetical protein C8046_10075 [Serinibacter arcticus]